MAEAADILSQPNQKVIIPQIEARCPMADQINLKQAEIAFQTIAKNTTKRIAPVVYMNSNADVKSFCGQKGGSVCTSSNANRIVKHYLDNRQIVFFSPDYNLGMNTARELKLKQKEIVKLTRDFEVEGDFSEAKVVLWDGSCYVHKQFSVEDIELLRHRFPGIQIIVHPECDPEVVASSDFAGSTALIYNLIKDSADGTVWGVGTEYNFVHRLAAEFPNKTILPLRKSICSDMAKITSEDLLRSLRNVQAFRRVNSQLTGMVRVKEDIKVGAAQALKKMIKIVEK
jgi:quinolinate synthase